MLHEIPFRTLAITRRVMAQDHRHAHMFVGFFPRYNLYRWFFLCELRHKTRSVGSQSATLSASGRAVKAEGVKPLVSCQCPPHCRGRSALVWLCALLCFLARFRVSLPRSPNNTLVTQPG